jgi:tRNA G18 (ribose-2'-O)-methylase SpoU
MKLPLTVVLNNVRSLYNVGSIFRTADGAGAEKLWLCGITGHPPQAKISKTALGAEDTVPWEHSWKIGEVVSDLRRDGYQIVLLERLPESVPYEEFTWKPPVALILGNENTGVSEGLIGLADAVVGIEMAGIKQCLNVTVAFGIIAYHIRKVLGARV